MKRPFIEARDNQNPGRTAAFTVSALAVAAGALLVWRFTENRYTPRADLAALEHAEAGENSANLRPESGLPLRALFTDVTAQVGLDFVHVNGATGDYYIPEEMGSGGAFLDYDDDNDMDIFLVQGGSLAAPDPAYRSRLFRNDGGVRFADVTDAAGAGVVAYGMGVICADYDNDGDVDVYVTCLGPNVLLRNNGDGTFSDVTEAAGVGEPGFSTAAAFFDIDGDELLDLYVANYVDWRPEKESSCYDAAGIRDYCHPDQYAPTADRLYRNLGGGRFEDASKPAGIGAVGNGLGVLAADFDGDDRIDVYVANDQTPAFLWMNQGDGTFRDEAALRGAAFSGQGVAIAGMGVAAEDLDGDGGLDLLVTNIYQQAHLCLRNRGGNFEDVSVAWGFGGWAVPFTGFGVGLFDQDHDGTLEAFVANGAVNRLGSPYRAGHPYAEPNQFVRRGPDGVFADASAAAGPAVAEARMSRGLALGDFDNDGDLDVLVTNNGEAPQLLRNENDTHHAWTMADLVDETGSRTAISARVEVRAGGRRFVRAVRPHTSYLSSHDPRIHIGLASAERIDSLAIQWPDGTREEWSDVPVCRHLRVRRGHAPEVIAYEAADLRVASAPVSAAKLALDSPPGARPGQADPGRPPMPRMETTPEGVLVARWDAPAVAAWCRSVGLPDPPALSETEADVAGALMEAFQQAARDGGAATLGRVGMILGGLEAQESAAAYLRRAAELDRSDFRWSYYLGCMLQDTGRTDQAVRWLSRAAELNADYAVTFARLGQLYLESGRIDDAERVLSRYAAAAPQDSLGHIGLGRVALARGETALALKHLQTAVALDPQFFQCHYYLGQAYAALGDEEKSAEHLATCGRLPRGHWFAMRDPLDRALRESAQSSQHLVDELARLQGTDQWPRMAELAEQIVRRRSNDTSMMGNLASIYCKMGRYDEAHRVLIGAQSLQPGSPRLATLRAEAYMGQERFEAALAAADEALVIDSSYARAHAARGRILVRLNRLAEAETDLRRAAELEPEVANHAFVLAELLRIMDRPDEAAALYERTLELAPDHPFAAGRLESIRRAQQEPVR